jgi:hypothetical protein
VPIDLTQMVAQPGVAEYAGQVRAPREAWGSRPAVGRSAELTRILALPRRTPELDGTERADAITQQQTARYTRGPRACRCAEIDPERHAAEGCIDRLRFVQAWALREIAICGGLVGMIGVGHGKTLLDLLAPFAFLHHMPPGTDPESLLVVLLVPPKLAGQLVEDYDYLGEHWQMPSMVIQGRPNDDRLRPGVPKLQVMPYSRLQRPEATDWMRRVRPHAIVSDECHKLRNRDSATVSRVERFIKENPGTRVAAWSGSITSNSITNHAHLSGWALGEGSPLPREKAVVANWSTAIDPSKNPADPGALLDGLIATGCCKPGESLYKGIRRRQCETLGVVTTSTSSADCKLEILERTPPPVPKRLQDLIAQALKVHPDGSAAWTRPDGEELVTALQAVECACTIACGFHYRWIFPHNEFPRDEQLVLTWIERRRLFFQELRAKLKHRDEHIDSPELAIRAAQRAYGMRPRDRNLPEWRSQMYLPWHEIKDQVKPEQDSVWLDDFLVDDAAAWAREHRGIVWFQYGPFGRRFAQKYKLPYYGAGKGAREALLAEDGSRSILVSIDAHGTGTNGLQFKFNEVLYPNLPAGGDMWEQSLGRVRRPGQPADVVRAWFHMHTRELRRRVRNALRAAYYVAGTTPMQQQILGGFAAEVFETLDETADDDGDAE